MEYLDLGALSEQELKARARSIAPLMLNAGGLLKSGDPIHLVNGRLFAFVSKPRPSPSWKDKLHWWLMWPYRRWPALLRLEMRIERWWYQF